MGYRRHPALLRDDSGIWFSLTKQFAALDPNADWSFKLDAGGQNGMSL